ncbi:uncharacterized protein LOC112552726 [Pogonomyrmex barbatus]|uniref:Uncharacterized protein LOC112552726 n=1 Tax=Pogonomyrmex barbatus TaxID=144034 RepID=A0A8N1S8R3_9HYME|nr:uncharacterized protein LOC112552726 [Pogonomyrmex barbatus]
MYFSIILLYERFTRNVFCQRKHLTVRWRNKETLERRAVRLLSRHYTLTATDYKFLEIGINVGAPSYVEIALGDHQGQELILSLKMWKGLYEQRWNIYKLLQNDYKNNFISIFIPLTVRICLMNITLIHLEPLNVRITMIESTLRHMFDLDRCNVQLTS